MGYIPALRYLKIHSSTNQMLGKHKEVIIIVALGIILAEMVKLRPGPKHLTKRTSCLYSRSIRRMRRRHDFAMGITIFQEGGQ